MALSAAPLSKSRFIAGLQCAKRLYLEVHRRDLLPEEDDPGLLAIFHTGDVVGDLACKRHVGGVLIDADHFHHADAVQATTLAMADAGVPAIFEAAFTFDGVKVRADILIRNDDGTWDLHEVKSATRVKQVHIADVAIQAYVLLGSGVGLRHVGILHLDRDYVLGSAGLDLGVLFRFADLGPVVYPLLAEVKTDVGYLHSVLALANVPEVRPGGHCYSPYECPFTSLCHEPAGPYDISKIPGGGNPTEPIARLGVTDVRLIPPGTPMTALQRRAVDSLATGREYVGDGLRAALEAVVFPVMFLDFEAFSPGVPRYTGTGVYQALPTQWSLLTLMTDGELLHAEFLHDEDSDPRRWFVESLLEALGDTGCIMVYSPYEATRLRLLAGEFPEHCSALLSAVGRFVDMLAIIREHYYHPEFDGSYSIKSVLPTLVPDLTYDDLRIQDGYTASRMYGRMIDLETSVPEKAEIREALLRYCERDTLAMVRVREALLARCR